MLYIQPFMAKITIYLKKTYTSFTPVFLVKDKCVLF